MERGAWLEGGVAGIEPHRTANSNSKTVLYHIQSQTTANRSNRCITTMIPKSLQDSPSSNPLAQGDSLRGIPETNRLRAEACQLRQDGDLTNSAQM